MPQRPKPWPRAQGGAWYAKIDRKQHWLAPAGASFDEADRALAILLAQRAKTGKVAPRVKEVMVSDVFNLFFEHMTKAVSRGELEQITLDGYARFLTPALTAFASIAAAEIRPKDVNQWLDQRKKWGTTTRHNAITAIKRAFRWAERAGHIETNPLVKMERPAPRSREAIVTTAQVYEILDATSDDQFRDLLTAIWKTGCRPGEVAGLTADRVNLSAETWTVLNKTRRKTRQPTRTIFLTADIVAMSRRLVAVHSTGAIFRNRRGNPWTRNAMACRFGHLRAKLGLGEEMIAYSLRHLYITDALEHGMNPAALAELVGHQDLKMIMRIYSKLRHRTEHLREEARKVRPDG